MAEMTIQKVLNWGVEYLKEKGIEDPRLSAELILCHVLSMPRIRLYTDFEKKVTKEQQGKFNELIKRAGESEPVAYLIGKTEFYSLELEISPACLIPRPETELLVERAVEFLRTRKGHQLVCDLCTGCGCIAVAIAKNFADCEIIATDISDSALETAAINIEKFNLQKRVKLLQGDLFEPIVPHLDTGKFDLIVSNPPYVSSIEYEQLEKNVKDYEPKTALFAGTDGLDIYKRIAANVDEFLKPDAALILEIGYAQGQAVKNLLEGAGFTQIRIEKDFHDNDRIVIARKTPN